MDLKEAKIQQKNLDGEFAKLHAKRKTYRDIIYTQETLPALEAQVGTYFAFRDNNYGSGREEDEIWDEFYHATHVEHGQLKGTQISINCDGKISVETDSDINSYLVPCEAVEFNACLLEITHKLGKL